MNFRALNFQTHDQALCKSAGCTVFFQSSLLLFEPAASQLIKELVEWFWKEQHPPDKLPKNNKWAWGHPNQFLWSKVYVGTPKKQKHGVLGLVNLDGPNPASTKSCTSTSCKLKDVNMIFGGPLWFLQSQVHWILSNTVVWHSHGIVGSMCSATTEAFTTRRAAAFGRATSGAQPGRGRTWFLTFRAILIPFCTWKIWLIRVFETNSLHLPGSWPQNKTYLNQTSHTFGFLAVGFLKKDDFLRIGSREGQAWIAMWA